MGIKCAMKDEAVIEILIADEHAICREALGNLLGQEPGFRVAGEAVDGEHALEQALSLEPGIMLLDLLIQRIPSREVLRRLQERKSSVPVLILAESIDTAGIIELLKLGARGVVLKESEPRTLFKSIRAVAAGDYWVGRKLVGALVEALRGTGQAGWPAVGAAPFNLTKRELEIIAEVAEGCTNKNIAEKLAIAEQTVKHHLTSIFQKIGVSNRLELAMFAMHHGIRGDS